MKHNIPKKENSKSEIVAIFVGGPADGRRQTLDHLPYSIKVPVAPPLRIDAPVEDTRSFSEAEYIPISWEQVPRSDSVLYAWRGLTSDEILFRLITNYHPTKPVD